MAKSSNNKSKTKSKQPTPEETAAKHRAYVQNRLPKLNHSNEPLFKSLIAALKASASENTLVMTSGADYANTQDAIKSLLELYMKCSDFQKIIDTKATLDTFLQSLANDAYSKNYNQGMLDMILSVLKPFIPNLSREYKAAYQSIVADSALRDSAKPFIDYLHAPQTGTELATSADTTSPDGLETPLEKLQYDACKLMDDLRAESSKWTFSLHHMYTVANPKIDAKSNSTYSPVYEEHACALPHDVSGELDYEEVDSETDSLIKHRQKIVGDDRYANSGTAVFGTAWDGDGNVVKYDENGGPFRDGWFGSVCAMIDTQQVTALKKLRRGRHFAAFLIAHTRDEFVPTFSTDVLTKPRHLHGAEMLPDQVTRINFMKSMGVNFNDYVETFNWITREADKKQARTTSFVATLQGLIKNYEIPTDWDAKLQYLVHESFGAIKDDKIPYLVSEVVSWLPDDKCTDYSHYAGVYDNQAAANGLNDAVIRNLHSPYNEHFHTAKLVGKKSDNKPFTYSMLRDFRSLVTHARGSNNLSGKTLQAIPNAIMTLIRTGQITVGDWKTLIHGSLNDADADVLLADKKFNERMTNLMTNEIKATIKDPNYDRKMLTTIITATTGGIGKSYLANLLGEYWTGGRTVYPAATDDKKKTPDLWQDYDNEPSANADELEPQTISWQTWKDTLDPHKVPHIPSRYTNKTPWAVRFMFITNVFPDGVSQYVRRLLRFAPGVGSLGYLTKNKATENREANWHLIEDDTDAAKSYLANLSQLLRRLPIWIEMSPTDNGKATNIKVSILAYLPSGRALNRYDYCHTKDSVCRINTVMTDKTPDDVARRIGVKVAGVIADLRQKADAVFTGNPTAWLPDYDGFIADDCDFGVRISKLSGEPVLTENLTHKDAKPLKTTDELPAADTAIYKYYDGNELLIKSFTAFVARVNDRYAFVIRGWKQDNHDFDAAMATPRENGNLDIGAVTDYFEDAAKIDTFLNTLYDRRSEIINDDLMTLLALMSAPKAGRSRQSDTLHVMPDLPKPEPISDSDTNNEADDIFG